MDVFLSNAKRQTNCRYCYKENKHGPYIDLKGQRFGRLIAEEYVGDSKWKCICDCGGETITLTNHLLSGHTQSCGCYLKDWLAETRFKDLTGQKFGKLKAIKRIENYITPKGKPLVQYECECECGIHVDVMASNLLNNNTTSCGCIRDCKDVKTIKQHILKSKIAYKLEYSINDLVSKDGNLLRFDFALKNQDGSLYCLIEYQGEQHYYSPERKTKFGKQAREETDILKRNYCRNNGILLYEIKYTEDAANAIDKIIDEYYACQSRAKQVV